MDTDSIQVTVRVRPLTESEQSRIPVSDPSRVAFGNGALAGGAAPKEAAIGFGHGGRGYREIIHVNDSRSLIFDPPADSDIERLNNLGGSSAKRYKDKQYVFDAVFDQKCTQEEVFRATAKPLLPALLEGYNATVFAYGATGCGKTHTINGHEVVDPDTGERYLKEQGVIQRTMAHLFELIDDKRDDLKATITVSYLEIYNETIRDLLIDEAPPRNGLALRKDSASRVSVVNLTAKVPQTPEEIQAWIVEGNRRRRTEMTNANATSSRSHAVLQINVRTDALDGGLQNQTNLATLSIIDLAGSERAAATSNLGARMKEGSAINKSLLALGNCINALCQRSSNGSRSHIPYRDSKLTRLLEFSLGGNCKTVMIVCISPYSVHFDDTQNTITYANRAKQIKVPKLTQNSYSSATHVKQYTAKISELSTLVVELKRQLAARKSEGGVVEKKKKAEVKADVDKAKSDLRSKSDQTRDLIVDGALCETIVAATEAKLRPIRARIAAIEAGSPPPGSSLAAERDILRQISRADEDLLRSNAFQPRLMASEKAAAGFEGVVRAVANRRLPDPSDQFAIDTVGTTASLCSAEMELAKSRVRVDKTKALAVAQAEQLATFASVFARSMDVMKSSKERLGVAAKLWEGENDPMVEEVREVARALGEVAASNAILFESILGATTDTSRPVASTVPPPRPMALSFPSAPNALAGPSTQRRAPPPAVAPAARGMPNLPGQPGARVRSSLAPDAAPQSGLASSPARRVPARSPGRAAMGSPRRGTTPKKSLRATAMLGGAAGRKTLRWRDQAGEGTIDDAARAASSAGEETETEWEDADTDVSSSQILPTITVQPASLRLMSGPPARRVSTLSVPGRPRDSIRPSFSALREDSGTTSSPEAPPYRSSSLYRSRLGDSFSLANSSLLANTNFSTLSSTDKVFSLFPSSPSTATAAPPTTSRARQQHLAASPAKRRTSIGPVRSERKRSRSSLIGGASHSSGSPPLSSSTHANHDALAPPPSSMSKHNSILGSGARRLLINNANGSPRKASGLMAPPAPPVPRGSGGGGAVRPSLGGAVAGGAYGRTSLAPGTTGPGYLRPTQATLGGAADLSASFRRGSGASNYRT